MYSLDSSLYPLYPIIRGNEVLLSSVGQFGQLVLKGRDFNISAILNKVKNILFEIYCHFNKQTRQNEKHKSIDW